MDRYTVISADGHGGGADRRLPAVPRRRATTTTSTPGRPTFENPYDDLEGDDGRPQLGQRPPPGRARGRRHRRRGHLPEHDPAVLPARRRSSHQPPAADAGDLDAALGGAAAHNRWLADFCAAAPGRRAGIAQILPARRRRRGRRGPLGRRTPGSPAACCSPARPPGSACAPLYAPDYEPLWQVCEELDMPVNHHTGSAIARLRRLPRGQGRCSSRGHVVGAPGAVAAHLRAACMERHPTLQFVFTEQGTAWVPERADDASTTSSTACARAAGSQEHVVGRRGDGAAVAEAERVLGPPVPRRVELHPPARGAAAPRGRRRPHHVGQRLPAPRGLLTRTPQRAPAPGVRRRAPRRGRGDGRRQRGRASTASTSTRSRPIGDAGRPARRRGRHARSSRARSRPRRCACPALRRGCRPADEERTSHGTHPLRRPHARASCATARSRRRRVGAWATSLVVDLRDRSRRRSRRCCRRRSSPTDEPLVRVSVATVDIGRGLPTVRRRHVRRAGAPRGHRRQLPARDADDHRAVGDRRPRDLRRAEEARRGGLDRDGDRVHGTVRPAGHDLRRDRRHASAADSTPPDGTPHRLLLQVPARARRQGLRRRAVARLLPPRRDDPRRCGRSTARSIAARVAASTRSPTCPSARLVSIDARPSVAASSAARSWARVPGEWLLPYVHQRYDDLSPLGAGLTRLMNDLTGRVAVVTGGAGGIGRAMGERVRAPRA